MKVKIELVRRGGVKEIHTLEIRAKKVTHAFLDQVDRAVYKAFGYTGWVRWNLLDILG